MSDLPAHTYFIGVVAVGWVIISLLFYFSEDSPIPRRVRPFMAIPCLFAFLLFLGDFSIERSKSKARSEVRNQIRSIAAADYMLSVNGREITEPETIVQALVGMRGVDANHSGPRPDKSFALTIGADDRQVHLSLIQDRIYDEEFWVFSQQYSAFRQTSDAISRITLPLAELTR